MKGSIFRWQTLKEVGPHELKYATPVAGRKLEVELISGEKVLVWRSEEGQAYFCHGLTFGGKDAPGGPVSPFSGTSVEIILQEHYELLSQAQASAGDILVWQGVPPESTPHSAVLTNVVLAPGQNLLDLTTRLQTKNGMLPETNLSLEELIELYGESYSVYRRG